MAYDNGRSSDVLTRKDMVFASKELLALLDKRTLAKKLNIETVDDLVRKVVNIADVLDEYVTTGRVERDAAYTQAR